MPASSPRGLVLGAAFAAVLVVGPASAQVSPSPPAAKAPQADPILLDFGLRAGFAHRLGDSAALPVEGRWGGVLGLGAAVAPTRWLAISLAWEHADVGSEHGHGDLADVTASRSLDLVWATLRLAALRTERFALLAELGPGLAVQHVSANVLVYPVAGRPAASACSASEGPGFALRAGVGAEVRLTDALWFGADAAFDHVRTGDGVLDGCAPGAGSLSLLGMRFAISWRADVTRWLR
jgi:hypothetical protein